MARRLDIELPAGQFGGHRLDTTESLTKRQSSLAFVWLWVRTGPDPDEGLWRQMAPYSVAGTKALLFTPGA